MQEKAAVAKLKKAYEDKKAWLEANKERAKRDIGARPPRPRTQPTHTALHARWATPRPENGARRARPHHRPTPRLSARAAEHQKGTPCKTFRPGDIAHKALAAQKRPAGFGHVAGWQVGDVFPDRASMCLLGATAGGAPRPGPC